MEVRILRGLQKKRALLFFSVAIFVVFSLVYYVFVLNDTKIQKLEIDPITIVGKSNINQYQYEIENLEWERDDTSFSKDLIKIKGWLVKKGEGTNSASIKIVFQDTVSKEYYLLPTLMEDRDDVTEKINDGQFYRYSGFSATVSYIDKLDNKNQDYALFALYQLNNKTILLPLNTTLKSWK